VFIHGGLGADWFADLVRRPALREYQLIRYHRSGYAGSDRVDGPLSIAQQAEHCRALLQRLGIAAAHVVGHSSGASIALQLAIDHPRCVRSLALLETALLTVPSGPFAGQALQQYGAGDPATAVDTWLRGVAGPGYRTVLDRVLPGAFDQAIADASTFFGQELPAVRAWTPKSTVEHPVLLVLGEHSNRVSPVYAERHEILLSRLPNAQPFVLPGATHLLHIQNPDALAERLRQFLRET